MNKKVLILLILYFISAINTKTIGSILTLFIEKYPNIVLPENTFTKNQSTISEALAQPSFLNPKEEFVTNQNTDRLDGVYALYKGYAVVSNFLGQITFPLQQQSETVYVVITENITPEYIVGPSTVGYWNISENSASAIYEMNIDYDDTANSYYINSTKKITALESIDLSLRSIIIIADPETVYVPEGATIAEFTPNLTLPTIYIKDTFDYVQNALKTLEVKKYFSKIKTSFQQNNLNILKLSTTN